MVKKQIADSRVAQKHIEPLSQETLNQIAFEIENAIRENAAVLASVEVEETGVGDPGIKIGENLNLQEAFAGYATIAKFSGTADHVASPVGIVGAIVPPNSPTVATAGLFLHVLKGRNALIVCPTPQAKNITGDVVDLIQETLTKSGVPTGLLQIVEKAEPDDIQCLKEGCNSFFSPDMVN